MSTAGRARFGSAWRVSLWQCWVRHGTAGHGRQGLAGRGPARLGRLGTAGLVPAWFGWARYGAAGGVRLGWVSHGTAEQVTAGGAL